LSEIVEGVFAAAGDQDLRPFVSQSVVPLKFMDDRVLQLIDPADGRILGEAFFNRTNRRTFDAVRRVEVRFTGAKADYIDALSLHRFGLRLNGEGGRWLQAACTMG
jgi:hypothetical protein